jgi:predicted RNA-binding protein with TRAM domain
MEEEGESGEGEREEAEGQEESQPAQETFRQGYGSGRRRTNPTRSFGSGERRGGGGGYGRREYGGPRGDRDRSRDRDRDHGPVPVEEGQELTLTIDALGRRGDGIARLNNFVIFVPGAQAGDQVKVRITTVRGSFATGEIVS